MKEQKFLRRPAGARRGQSGASEPAALGKANTSEMRSPFTLLPSASGFVLRAGGIYFYPQSLSPKSLECHASHPCLLCSAGT